MRGNLVSEDTRKERTTVVPDLAQELSKEE
jgi:hypothetical protein